MTVDEFRRVLERLEASGRDVSALWKIVGDPPRGSSQHRRAVDWPVCIAWIDDDVGVEYVKLRPEHGAIEPGRLVSVLRMGDARWRPARVVARPPHLTDVHPRCVWLELV